MKPRKRHEKEHVDLEVFNHNITESDVGEYIREAVLMYGINVSVFRACSAILDGLTPVKRRMIYTFYTRGFTADKKRVKATDALGPVTGLHPHGELSINNSFTNEIKSWETNAPLFDVHGNAGSLTGESAAAVRYLETRLSKFAMKCFFDDFDPDITDMVESNTRTTKEPVTIPSKYPYFLLSLNTGIGWGNAMSLPPFNLVEVFKLTQALLMNPRMDGVYLYPDSPRGYQIVENENILNICETGHGTLTVQAVMQYHEQDKLRYISVKGFPEQTYMDPIMADISRLVKEKQIFGIKTLRDNTSLDLVEFWVVLTDEADPTLVMDMLYKKTRLRTHVCIDMNFAGRTKMQPLGLKASLLFWIENRLNVKQKWLLKQMSKKKARIHAIHGIMDALSPKNLDRTIEIIRHSTSDDEAVRNLIKEYEFTTYQANIINELKLNRISRGNQDKFLTELEKLDDDVDELESIVTSRNKIKELVYEELEEGIKLFGKPRHCDVVSADALESPVHYYTIVLTKKYIKKMSVNTTTVGQMDSDDEVISLWKEVPGDAIIRVLDNLGGYYGVKLERINPVDAVNRGTPLTTFGIVGMPIKGVYLSDEQEEMAENYSMVIFTNNGFIKRTILNQYLMNRLSTKAITLNDGDSICYMSVIRNESEGDEHYPLIYTAGGNGISINLLNIPCTDRTTKGSRFLQFDNGDSIQGTCEMDADKLFILTSRGFGKICMADDIFKTSKRRANMIKLTGLDDNDTVFKVIPITDDLKKVTCVMQSGERVDILLKDVKELTRVSKCKKLVGVKRGDSIIRLKY